MAGLKKKKQEKSSSPNIVLVIFLVFFFLVSIVLGIFVYTGYDGQAKFLQEKNAAVGEKKRETARKEYWAALYRNLRDGIGGDVMEANELDKDDNKQILLDDFGRFKDEEGKAAAKKLMDDIKAQLPGSDKESYKSDLLTQLKAARKDAEEWKVKTDQAAKANKRLEDYTDALEKKNIAFQLAVRKDIKDNSDAQLKVVQDGQRSEAFEKYVVLNKELRGELEKNKDELTKVKEEHQALVINKEREIDVLKTDLKKALAAGGGGQPAGGGRGGETFPLVLDISPGRPLWDYPIGKIMSVDMDSRQVVINLGHEYGAKPELTFNIFGPNTYGRAVGSLKATIEVIKVVDANTSLCRITSLYDADGREIALQGKLRQRETDAPLREGDLLYNLFWGTRVAVAGYVNITGEPSDSAAEQKRQMSDFIHMLKRNGMTVDAYVDLHDGKVVGSISPKTRYLIRGDGVGAAPAPPKAEEGKDPPKDQPANADRNEAINKSIRKLRDDAKEYGLLQISAENFANVIGYRKARSALSPEMSGFRPTLPDAGTGRVIASPDDRPPMEPQKKEVEKKDVDKKDP